MSIDSSIPDLENQAQESNKAEDDIEIQDNSRPELKKKAISNFGDLKYKTYTEDLMKLLELKIWKVQRN